MTENKYLSIPIEDFSMKKVENDDRLVKIHLKLMHDGVNANSSEIDIKDLKRDFKKYVTDSIGGIPIVAGFSKNKKREDDFSGHDDDEQILGSVFNDSCNAQFVYDEKYKRTFIEVDGYIYRYYSNGAVDILENAKNNKRACSVELEVLDGAMDKKRNVYQIKEWRLLAVTLLSSDIAEGMKGSCAELSFSEKSIDTLKQLNEDINKAFSKQINNKGGVEDMIFNKKEHLEKLGFSLTVMQLVQEFSKACRSVQYDYEYSDGEVCKFTKFYFQDYDSEYIYARDCEHGHMVGLKYSFEGDMPKIDFESALRMKIAYQPFDMGEDKEDEELDFSIRTLEISQHKLEKEIEEFKATPIIEDKTQLVTDLEVKVSEFSSEIEDKNKVILDLGLELQDFKTKFEAKELILTELESKLEVYTSKEEESKIEALKEEFKAKSNELYSKFMHGFTQEEMEKFKERSEEVINEELFKEFKEEIEQLALSKFTAMSKIDGGRNFSNKGRIPIEENIEQLNKVNEKENTSIWSRL